NGRIREYVLQYVSRYAGSDGGAVATGKAVAQWALDNEQDRAGNRINYQYALTTSGTYVLTRISYASHGNDMPALRYVQFNYETRADPQTLWQRGVRTDIQQRLHSIEMWAPNPATTAKVWEYDLGYTYSASS